MDTSYLTDKLRVNGMKATYLVGYIAIILLFSCFVPADSTATVHGTTYEWNTFTPLNNTLISVNSTPEQSMVAKYGIYSSKLPNGTYLVTASNFKDAQLVYYYEELITISDNGIYVVDLLLLPVYSDNDGEWYFFSGYHVL